LDQKYEEEFFKFEASVTENNPVSVEGKRAVSEAQIRPIHLMKLEDVLDHLRSFLMRTRPDVMRIHASLLDVMRNEFGATASWREVEVPAQAQNLFDN
jgi:hypothetical protein